MAARREYGPNDRASRWSPEYRRQVRERRLAMFWLYENCFVSIPDFEMAMPEHNATQELQATGKPLPRSWFTRAELRSLYAWVDRREIPFGLERPEMLKPPHISPELIAVWIFENSTENMNTICIGLGMPYPSVSGGAKTTTPRIRKRFTGPSSMTILDRWLPDQTA